MVFRIAVPSIIFAIIEFFPSAIIHGNHISLGYCIYKTIGGETYWFTGSLAVAELSLLLLFCTRITRIWFYIIICLVVAIMARYVFGYNDAFEPWAWNRGLISLAFLALGGFYWKYEGRIDKFMKRWFIVPLVIIYTFMVSRLSGLNNPLISMHTIQPLGYVTCTISCILLVWLAKMVPERKVLKYLGKNTLGLYFMSGALPIVLGILFHRIVEGIHLWNMLLVFMLSLSIALVAVIVINSWAPWMWDLRKIKKT